MKFPIKSYVVPSEEMSSQNINSIKDFVGEYKSSRTRFTVDGYDEDTKEYLIECRGGCLWVEENEIEKWSPKNPLNTWNKNQRELAKLNIKEPNNGR